MEYTLAAGISLVPPATLREMSEVYAKSGWNAYVQMNLGQLLKPSMGNRFPPFVLAAFYARLGRKDDAITWLDKGYEERDFRMTLISVAFEFDAIRSDPRFRDLVRRVGLPE